MRCNVEEKTLPYMQLLKTCEQSNSKRALQLPRLSLAWLVVDCLHPGEQNFQFWEHIALIQEYRSNPGRVFFRVLRAHHGVTATSCVFWCSAIIWVFLEPWTPSWIIWSNRRYQVSMCGKRRPTTDTWTLQGSIIIMKLLSDTTKHTSLKSQEG